MGAMIDSEGTSITHLLFIADCFIVGLTIFPEIKALRQMLEDIVRLVDNLLI